MPPGTPYADTAAPSMMLPAPGTVAVWWLQLREVSAVALARWLPLLDEEEQAKAVRFRFEADRRQYIAAHALARVMLAFHVGSRPNELRFRREVGGRPELEGKGELRFSLSHTRTLVACAVSNIDAVGLDVEACNRGEASLDIAQTYFAPAEAQLVRDFGPDTFLRLWTLKEAFLKATGEGLSRPLNSFAFSLDPIRVNDGGGEGWRFAQFIPVADHLLAVALHRPGFSSGSALIEPRQIATDEL